MDIDLMQEIALDLAVAEGVRLDQPGHCYGGRYGGGMMYVEFGFVEGPKITGPDNHYPNAESQYLTCLHEIGHHHWGHTQGRPWTDEYKRISPDWEYWDGYWEDREAYFNNGVLKSEAQAWNYALDHCEIPSEEILPETRKFMWETCLGSYFRGAQAAGFDTPGQMLYNGDRHHVKFAYGKPDRYFMETKRRIVEGDLPDEPLSPKEKEAREAAMRASRYSNTGMAQPTVTPSTLSFDNGNMWSSGTTITYVVPTFNSTTGT